MADEQFSERNTFPSEANTQTPAQEASLDPTRQVSCPACGFLQPEDLYCASCGKSLRKLAKTQRIWWQNPMVWVGTIVILGVGTWFGLDSARQTASQSSEGDVSIFRNATQRAKLLKAEGDGSENARRVAQDRRERFSSPSSASSESLNSDSMTEELVEPNPVDAMGASGENFGGGRVGNLTDSASNDPTLAPPSKTSNKAANATKSRVSAAPEPSGASALSTAQPIQLHLVAAQVPAEWLASIGVSTPGFHRAPGLEKILRSQRQGLRVLSVHSESLTAAVSVEASTTENFSLDLNGQGRFDIVLQAYAPDTKQIEVVMSSAKHRTDRSPASLPPQQNVLEIDREAMQDSGWVLVSGAQDPVVLIFARSSSRKP